PRRRLIELVQGKGEPGGVRLPAIGRHLAENGAGEKRQQDHSITLTSGQRPRALSTTRRQSRASPRCGLGRRVIENTSSSPNGAATLIVWSSSSRIATAKAGATKRARASSVAATGA